MSRDDNFRFFTSFRGVNKEPKLAKGVHTSTTARPGMTSGPEVQIANPGIVSDGDKCIHPAKSKPKKRKPVNESEAADHVTLESILWSDEEYTAQQLASQFDGRFPIIVRVRRGFTDDSVSLVRGQVLQIHSYGKQKRVVGRDAARRKFSIPFDYPMNVFVRGSATGGDHWRFSAAMEVKRLPVSVKVTEVDETANQMGESLTGAELSLTAVKEAVYLRANSIKDGWIDQSRITVIPDFLDAQFSVAVGMCAASEQEWIDYHGMFARCVRHLKFFDLNGLDNVICKTVPEGEEDDNTSDYPAHSYLHPSRSQHKNGNSETTHSYLHPSRKNQQNGNSETLQINGSTETARRCEKIIGVGETPDPAEYEMLRSQKYQNVELTDATTIGRPSAADRSSISEENRVRTLDYVRKSKKDREQQSSTSSQASVKTSESGQVNNDNPGIIKGPELIRTATEEAKPVVPKAAVFKRNQSIDSNADSVANVVDFHENRSVNARTNSATSGGFSRSQSVASEQDNLVNNPVFVRSESVASELDNESSLNEMFDTVIELGSFVSRDTNPDNPSSDSVSETATEMSALDNSDNGLDSNSSNARIPNGNITNANNNSRRSGSSSQTSTSENHNNSDENSSVEQRNERNSDLRSQSSSRQSDSGIEPQSPVETNHASLFRPREKSVKQLANAFLNNNSSVDDVAEKSKVLQVTHSTDNSKSDKHKVKFTTQSSVTSTKSDDLIANVEENKPTKVNNSINNNINKNPIRSAKPPPSAKPSKEVISKSGSKPPSTQQFKSVPKPTVAISHNRSSETKPDSAAGQSSESKSVTRPTVKISQSSDVKSNTRPVVSLSPTTDSNKIPVNSVPAISPISVGKPKRLPPQNNTAGNSATSGITTPPVGKNPAPLTEVNSVKGIQKVEDIPAELIGLGVNDVCACLKLLGLDEYEKSLERQQIDGARLSDLTEAILQSRFNFSAFNASKLMRFVRGWRP